MNEPGSRTRHAWPVAGLVAALLAWMPTWAAGAEDFNPAKAMYLKYCSACHGEEGKGDGVVSGFMRPRPTDLTQLAKKAGDGFPFLRTLEAIDGTSTIRAHGDSNMPVWGELFRAEAAAPIVRQAEIRGKVMMITDHIRSIQAK